MGKVKHLGSSENEHGPRSRAPRARERPAAPRNRAAGGLPCHGLPRPAHGPVESALLRGPAARRAEPLAAGGTAAAVLVDGDRPRRLQARQRRARARRRRRGAERGRRVLDRPPAQPRHRLSHGRRRVQRHPAGSVGRRLRQPARAAARRAQPRPTCRSRFPSSSASGPPAGPRPATRWTSFSRTPTRRCTRPSGCTRRAEAVPAAAAPRAAAAGDRARSYRARRWSEPPSGPMFGAWVFDRQSA